MAPQCFLLALFSQICCKNNCKKPDLTTKKTHFSYYFRQNTMTKCKYLHLECIIYILSLYGAEKPFGTIEIAKQKVILIQMSSVSLTTYEKTLHLRQSFVTRKHSSHIFHKQTKLAIMPIFTSEALLHENKNSQ